MVTDEFRRPIVGARVEAPGLPSPVLTDRRGIARFVRVPPGVRFVRATAEGFTTDSVTVNASAADTVRAELVLLRSPTGIDSISFVRAAPPLDSSRLRLQVDPRAVVRYRQVRFVASTVRAGSVVRLQLFEDVAVTLVVGRVERFRVTGSRITGTVSSPSGQVHGTASLVLHEGRLTGNIRIGPALYVIRPQVEGVHTIVEADPLLLSLPPRPPAPVDTLLSPLLPLLPLLPERPKGIAELAMGPPTVRPPQPISCGAGDVDVGRVPEIRVLVGYSPLAAEKQGSAAALEEMIALAVDEMQVALVASGIELQVTIAAIVGVGINETATEQGADYWFNLLLSPPASQPALWTFRQQRETYFADAVVLVSEYAIGGRTMTPLWPRHGFADTAYAVVGRAQMNTQLTLAHELGHMLGGNHEHLAPAFVEPPEAYAAPFRCVQCISSGPPGSGWVTLMGLSADGAPVGYLEKRIQQFSNPERTYEGKATGVPIGAPEAADHHATMGFSSATVAAYRATPAWFVAASASGPWAERHVAPEDRDQIRLADLDGDRLADAFKVDPLSGTWWWSRDSESDWTVRNGPDASLAVPITSVRFGDFNGDGAQDVFWIAGDAWMVSYGGSSGATVLRALGGGAKPPLAALAFGDFMGDGRTDVFWSDASTGAWWISNDGSGPWVSYLPADPSRRIATSALRFADLDGDGRTDVFQSRTTAVNVQWRYVAAGTAVWTNLLRFSLATAPALDDLGFGRFSDGVGDDVLVTAGGRWRLSLGGSAPLEEVAKSCHRMPTLWIADIDGDGIADLFRTGVRP